MIRRSSPSSERGNTNESRELDSNRADLTAPAAVRPVNRRRGSCARLAGAGLRGAGRTCASHTRARATEPLSAHGPGVLRGAREQPAPAAAGAARRAEDEGRRGKVRAGGAWKDP